MKSEHMAHYSVIISTAQESFSDAAREKEKETLLMTV